MGLREHAETGSDSSKHNTSLLAEILGPRALQLLFRPQFPDLFCSFTQLHCDWAPWCPCQYTIPLHDLTIYQDDLDIGIGRMEDDTLEWIQRAREIRGECIEYDQISLLPSLDGANEMRKIQGLGTAKCAHTKGVLRVKFVMRRRSEIMLVNMFMLPR